MCNHFIARTGKFLPVCRLHLGDRCAAWKVKFFRVGIENVGLNRRAASRGSSAASRRTSCSPIQPIDSGCCHFQPFPVRLCFLHFQNRPPSFLLSHNRSQYQAGHYRRTRRTALPRPDPRRIPPPSGRRRQPDYCPQNRCHAVHDMVSGFFHVIGCQIFKWQHSLYVQIAGSGNQVLTLAFSAVSW